MNNLELAVALVVEPKRAFKEIEERPRFLFPLLAMVLVSAGATLWYYSIVDTAWLIDNSLRSSTRGRNMTEEQMAQVSRLMSRNTLMYGSLVSVVLVTVILRLLESTWYLLAGKVTNVQRSFKQWFSLASWTSLPQVLSVLPAIPLLLTANSPQLDASALSPLSLNELLFHRGMGEAGYTLFTSINLLHFFTAFLVVLGVKLWSGRSWLFAALYALLPVVLIGGVWAFLALK
jgi:Yip1 domain